MKQIKIIGIPAPVSERGHRIVLDKYLRSPYGIPSDGFVKMEYTPEGWIRILPNDVQLSGGGIVKSISGGRFNLPKEWANSNHINIGEFVNLIMTDLGILISSGSIDLYLDTDHETGEIGWKSGAIL